MNDTELRTFVTSKLPESLILDSAKQLGIIRRNARFELVLFVWTLTLCSFSASTASVAHFYRQYLNLSSWYLSRSTFYARFHDQMAQLFARLFEHLLETTSTVSQHWLHEHLDLFDGVLALDSTTVALRKSLEHAWQACLKGKSALKLHAIYNVLDMQLYRVQFSDAKTHDICGIKQVAQFCHRKLLLFDMAYISLEVLSQIQGAGGFFVCRLPSHYQPVILRELVRGRGRPTKLANKRLRWELGRLTRQELDLWVRLGSDKNRMECRLVGRRDKDNKWRLYLTSLAAAKVEGDEVVELYRARWQVELLFKQLKSQGRLHTIEGKSVATIKLQMYAILMGYVVCGALVWEGRRARGQCQASMTRGLEALRVMGAELVELVCPPKRRRSWFERFAHMAQDPNVDRTRHLDPFLRISTFSKSPQRQRLAA
jgi:putative transposase